MSSVAEDFPAHTDSNGNTWYRPVRDKGIGMDQWGWTSNPVFADPSYAQDVTLCSTDGATAGDRAAILEFAAQLHARAKAAGAETESGTGVEHASATCADIALSVRHPAVVETESGTPGSLLPVTVPGWLPAWPDASCVIISKTENILSWNHEENRNDVE